MKTVTISHCPLMPDQLVDCIATGREPTMTEIGTLAERVWHDSAAHRSAFSWGDLSPSSPMRVAAYQIARHALVGSLTI